MYGWIGIMDLMWNVCACVLSHFSHVRLSATPWTTAHQASLAMGFSKKEYWSGLPFSSPVINYEVSKVSEVKSLSHVRLFETPWTAAYQAPPCTGFSRQEYWSGLPFPSPIMWNVCIYICIWLKLRTHKSTGGEIGRKMTRREIKLKVIIIIYDDERFMIEGTHTMK